MAHSLLNSSPILSGSVTLPRRGVWHADLVVDAVEAPTGPATVRLGAALVLRGTVERSSLFAGQVRVRVVGGAGRLATELPPQWYAGAPRELPLRDAVELAGERLSSTTDAALLAEVLTPGWSRVAGPAALELERLLDGTGASWRILPDGSLWAGPEAWPSSTGMGDLVILEDDQARGRLVVATEGPTLLPGQRLRGRQVSDVVYRVEPERLRVEAWLYHEQASTLDRLKGALLRIVEGAVRRRTDHLGSYLGTVVQTDAGGRVEVRLDDTARPPVTAVTLRAGTPGTTLRLVDGARVLVSWQGGDPRYPIAQPWDEGGLKALRTVASEKIELSAPKVSLDDAGRDVARVVDLVGVGGPSSKPAEVALVLTAPVTVATPSGPGAISQGTILKGMLKVNGTLYGAILTGNAKVKG